MKLKLKALFNKQLPNCPDTNTFHCNRLLSCELKKSYDCPYEQERHY